LIKMKIHADMGLTLIFSWLTFVQTFSVCIN
jgi:hypothetical protein